MPLKSGSKTKSGTRPFPIHTEMVQMGVIGDAHDTSLEVMRCK